MGTEKVTIEPLHALSMPAQTRRERRWLTSLRSPLWMCLLLAVTVRIWLIIHTHGVIAGDEAMVGIQAEHILRGEHPLYYYSQPYMGSLEAYFLAITFAIADRPSILLLAKHDANPPLLHALDAEHVTYRVARFLSEPGFDILVLTPLSRTVSPFEPGLARVLQPLFDGCY